MIEDTQLGYTAPIHRALWERILTMGVPRLWFIVVVSVGVFAAFCVYSLTKHIWLSCVPLGVGGVALLVLRILTYFDPDWDSVLFHSLRYPSQFEAG
jgi:type IV secretory pathway TrbD component